MVITDWYLFWTYLPTGGGPLRVYNINRNLSKIWPVTQISLRPTYKIMQEMSFKELIRSNRVVKIDPSYIEYQVFRGYQLPLVYLCYKFFENPDLFWKKIFVNINSKYILDRILNSNIFQIEHIALFDIAEKYNKKGVPLFLSAHNVETELQTNRIARNIIFKLEETVLESVDGIFATSELDAKKFRVMFGANKRKIHIVPNGTDTKNIIPPSKDFKESTKLKLNLKDKKVVLFIGGYYKPNIEAVIEILKIAKHFDDTYVFLIVGTVGEYFRRFFNSNTYRNVRFEGFVKDLKQYLQASDIAINPIQTGSGTNIKMLDYLAAGLPIISTPFGARGLKLKPFVNVIISEIREFKHWIIEVLENPSLYYKLSKNGRKLAEIFYDWEVISKKIIKVYKKYL